MTQIEKNGTGISPSLTEVYGDAIYTYTRAQAIEDGLLVDVSDNPDCGRLFKVPVALTRAVWERYVAVPTSLEGSQDESARLWDILWMTHQCAKFNTEGADMAVYLTVEMPDVGDWIATEEVSADFGRTHRKVRVNANIGPGDDGRPVITIMMPGED